MKICVISTSVFSCPVYGYSGLEQLAWLQAKGLAAKGHQVSLVAPTGSTCPNVEIIETGPAGQWDEATTYSRYWNRLTEFQAVIDNSWNKWAYVLKQEGRLNAPVLGVMHAPVNTMYQSPPPVPKPCIVCISEDQKQHYEAIHGNAEARTCYNGIDMQFYKPIGVPRKDRFLFLARFSTIKSPDLCQSVCLKTCQGLDLVGDTSITQEPEFLRKVQDISNLTSPGWDHDKGKQLRMVGPASRSECVHWFSQAKALLHLNQRFREPFGLAPCEAMACEAPVLAWRYGAMKETVKHGETGFLIGSEEEAVEVIKSGALDLIDRSRCRQWVGDNFSYERMINRYEELITEALNTGGW